MRYVTGTQVSDWITQAEIGDALTYHVGYLAIDRMGDTALDEAASRLWSAARKGTIQLTQLRIGDRLWAYLARKVR